MATPYATIADLAARWPQMPGDSATQNTATVLLGDASFWLRKWFPTETALIDAGADGTGALILVCTMVKRAMVNADNLGVRQETQAMGPQSESWTYSNPDGNLYITDAELTLIKGGGRARSVRLATPGLAMQGTPTYGAIGQPGPTLWPDAQIWPPFPNLP